MATEIERGDAYPPGDVIREELEARGWSQQDLAEIMGKSHVLVSEIVNAKRSITRDTAVALSAAFGTSAEIWLNLDTRYRLTQAKARDRAIPLRAMLREKAPVREMVKRGWIEPSKNPEALTKRILAFFERESLDEEFAFRHAARKSGPVDAPVRPAQSAWLHRARHMARALQVRGTWKAGRAAELTRELRTLAMSAQSVGEVPKVLAEYGVRFVVVQPLPGLKMHGASFWLRDEAPVIAHAMLYDRIDNFWHTLMHEIGHLAAGDALSIDEELLNEANPSEAERLADRYAIESLIPQHELEDFCVRAFPLFSQVKITGFAARLRIHPGIVVGQLHHKGPERRGLPFTHFNKLLSPIRHIVTPTALADGWGKVVSLNQ